ncbi:MAG: ABC transporter permease [Clostridia bacterium]|nr:ABC transporter permease [Clostridia bacterium]MDD4386739.1 ABC transporter permease [Clostridia bacterium]
MQITISLAIRNTKLFLRDKSAVFFSFLSMFIIIGLYALFLGDVQVKQIEQIIGKLEGIRWLVDSWIIAGIIAVNTVNTTMFSLTTIVNDIDSKVVKDLYTAPIKKWQIALGYILSSWITGILMSVISIGVGQIYIYLTGGELLSLIGNLKVIGVTILSVISFSSALFFLFTFINSPRTVSTIGSIVGTLVGFIAGIYIPMGALPEGVQTIMKTVPVTYSTSMFRQIFMEEPLNKVFEGAPVEKINDYIQTFGVKIYWGNSEVSWIVMIGILLGFSLVFYILSIIKLMYFKRFE